MSTKLLLSDYPNLKAFFDARDKEKFQGHLTWGMVLVVIFIAAIIAITLTTCRIARAEEWTATAYCPCFRCCQKTDGITACGVKAREGITVAVNWLKFGTPIYINGKKYIVQDRGAKSIFGTKKNPKKRVDIYFNSHQDALQFGKRKIDVET